MRPRTVLALFVVAAVAAGCGSSSPSHSSSTGHLTIGAAGFTESNILANMYAQLLAHAGFSTSITTVESTEIFESSLERGQIAVVPEYAATYADFLNQEIHGSSAPSVASPSLSATLAALRPLAAAKGLTVLQPAQAVDQNAFAVTTAFAAAHHLSTLSDLGRSGIAVTIAGPPECATRPFCALGLERVYGIKVAGVDKLGFDTIQTKTAVQHGKDQLAEVATTDATLSDFGLVELTDDRHLQEADYLVPIVNSSILAKYPQIATVLNKLAAVLTTTDLGQLDEMVDVDRQTPAAVAQGYLTSQGLL